VDFVARHWGDLASLVGFGLTIWAIFKAKGAAEQARDAARQVRDRISSLDTVAALAAAVTTLEELKGLHRIRAWDLVLVRYSALRRHLVTIEAGLAGARRGQITKALSQFRIIEAEVEGAMASRQQNQIDSPRFNQIVSAQIDALEKLMIAIKQAGV
jgi:hypothetical protein